MKRICIALTLLFVLACRHHPAGPKHAQAVISPKHPKPAADTAFITGRCAVLYGLSARKTERLKKLYYKGRDDDFYIVMDDNLYYLATSREELKKAGMRVIDTEREILCFKAKDGHVFTVNLQSYDYAVAAYLFDGQHKPVEGDITNITPYYEQFRKGQ